MAVTVLAPILSPGESRARRSCFQTAEVVVPGNHRPFITHWEGGGEIVIMGGNICLNFYQWYNRP